MTPPGSTALHDDASRPSTRCWASGATVGPSRCRSPRSCQFVRTAPCPGIFSRDWVANERSNVFFERVKSRWTHSPTLLAGCFAASRVPSRALQRLLFRPRVHSLRFFAVFGPRSSALDLHLWGSLSKKALTELLRCQDFFALQPGHLADYDIDKLWVTKKDAVDLVSPSPAEVLRHPCSSMFRSSAELLHLEEPEGAITPYWDPTLRRDARQRVDLFHKLAEIDKF